ncbi:MAG: thiolase family protein [Desulfobacula sp.]|uniref:thiolase family protein n=1 Tax=Desulfobacula sp. TaxID=2593537 RepID=UPI0025C0EC60|nr:thiolase family protein [Desulfobacula sp.]MCD4722709.1 thiolase family protein [Desulfobacula sp.]
MLTKAFIPYKGYYSSPFSKWQGSLANEHSIVLGSETAKNWFKTKDINPDIFDYLILGATVGQPYMFYGGPWTSALTGAHNIPGCLVSQACSTSTTVVFQAAMGIETGTYKQVFTLMTDRCSNGPHTIWPNPKGPGGQVISENWVMDQFNNDPWAKNAMIQTAENVAKETGVTREQCDEVALRRYEQYTDSLANDREFQKKYMFPVTIRISRKKTIQMDADEGIMPSTKEGLEKLRPVLPDGSHTFGSQTHPADGNCGVIVTSRKKAEELSQDSSKDAQIVSYGFSRSKKGFMAMAVVPAAQMALDNAGISIKDVKVIKTHNPFAANDIYLADQMNIDVHSFNNYGSSMIFGHPQAPTAGRLIIEGIEELADKGGGYLLFTGCAAGDTGAALILKIGT